MLTLEGKIRSLGGSVPLLVMLGYSQPSPRLARSSFSHLPSCFSVLALPALGEATPHHQKWDRSTWEGIYHQPVEKFN